MQQRKQQLITLKQPYFKIKTQINAFAIRGVVFAEVNTRIIPLVLFAKKDKKYGHNVSWVTHKDLIGKPYDKALDDIENGNFEVFG